MTKDLPFNCGSTEERDAAAREANECRRVYQDKRRDNNVARVCALPYGHVGEHSDTREPHGD